MKAKREFEFDALSLDRNAHVGERLSDPSRLQPRLTPESVEDFNVHQIGSADSELTQPERLGATRHCAAARKLALRFMITRYRWRVRVAQPPHFNSCVRPFRRV